MPDKKLTDNEIKKALRSWLEEIRKSRQAYSENVGEEHYPSMRYEYLLSDTIHEINRLQADCENYKQVAENQQKVTMDRGFEIKRLKEKIESLQAENERLHKNPTIPTTGFWNLLCGALIVTETLEEYNKFRRTFKSEAYKEFADDLKERANELKQVRLDDKWAISQYDVNKLLKEKTGEDNG